MVRGVTAGNPGIDAPGRIVFGVDNGDGPALLAIRPDGTDLREIHAPAVCCASVSPDGGTVMFSSDYEGEQDVVQFSPVMPQSGGFSEAWTAAPVAGPNAWPGVQLYPGAWSGFDFALEGVSQEDPRKDGIYLSIDNGGGMAIGEFVRMTGAPDGARDIPLAFSPDGSKLIFIRDSGISSELGRLGDLYVIDKGTTAGIASGAGTYRPGEARRLNPADTLVLASQAFGSGASWSPDGTRVAFSAFSRAGDTVSPMSRAYVVDVAGGEATPISDETSFKTSAHWSPDGQWIAHDVARPMGGIRDVWISHPDGSDAHKVASLTGGSCCAVWSPDSKWLLAEGGDADGSGLYVIAVDGSRKAGLATPRRRLCPALLFVEPVGETIDRQSGNASGPRSCSSRASPEASSAGSHEYG